MPSVYVVSLQLTKLGPPATQNFPLLCFFPSVAMLAGRFYTPYDARCSNLHILTARGMSHIFGSNWQTSRQEKNILHAGPKLKFENCESVQHRLISSGIKKGSKISFHRHFNSASLSKNYICASSLAAFATALIFLE